MFVETFHSPLPAAFRLHYLNVPCQATSKALTFVVIIPFWEDSVGWKRLRDSAFLSKHVKLDQKGAYCCSLRKRDLPQLLWWSRLKAVVVFLQLFAALLYL